MGDEIPLPVAEQDRAVGKHDQRTAKFGVYRGGPAQVAALEAVVAVVNVLRLGMVVPANCTAAKVTAVAVMGGVTLHGIRRGGQRCVMILHHRGQHERGMHGRTAEDESGCQQPNEKTANGHFEILSGVPFAA